MYSEKGLGRSAENHYPTMSLEDIKNLPINNLADKNCALFMWTTIPLLKDSFSVLDSWGFEYKSIAFVWIKLNKNLTHYFGVWDIGQGLMLNYAFWRQKVILNANPQRFIK